MGRFGTASAPGAVQGTHSQGKQAPLKQRRLLPPTPIRNKFADRGVPLPAASIQLNIYLSFSCFVF